MLQDNITRSTVRYPDSNAYRFLDRSMTYQQLDRESNRLSRLLAELGVSRGDRVGIMLNRCMETPLAVYAIMKAGAAFVPMDPDMPIARVSSLVQSCEMTLIVSTSAQRETLLAVAHDLNTPLVVINCEIASLAETSEKGCSFIPLSAAQNFDHSALSVMGTSPSDIAYIMFTSGSTGAPKGIVHTHESGNAYARRSVKQYGITSEDVIGNHAPLHFDISTMGYLSSPFAGACAVIIPDAYTRLPASMSQLMEDERMTIWYSVPFAIIQLMSRGGLESRNLEALRWVLYGGEPFAARHVRALMDRLPAIRISNVYGPAEVNQCTYYTVPSDITGNEESISIGHVCEGSRVLIVDDQDRQIKRGETGELLIASPTMMQGYYRRPELNRACFQEVDGVRYYRSRDLASRGLDGLLYYHGRMDQQVKIRGNRIEIDELENLVMQDPAVEEAAAYAVSAGTEGERVEVSVLLTHRSELDTKRVLDQVAAVFPSYARPEKIVVRSEFPRTTSGKIDRRKLASDANVR